jgi:phospholipid/cholesterol/gamma-HCH transport system substrate-binding protein
MGQRMTEHERGLEFKVGAFVFVGLAMLGALVVQFGRLGEGFKTYYPLTVRFSDASGLLKGSDVLLAGAKIGKVAGGPRMVREGNGVEVPLKIYDYIKIPEGSKITVGSSGLLGDRFVNVTMPPGQPKNFIAPKSYIVGTRETGFDDLTREGGELVGDLRKTVQNIDTTVTRLNQEALSPTTMQNWKASVEHLNVTTASLAESSKKLDAVVDTAGSAMGSIRKDADDMQLVIADARKTVQAATQAFRQATEGKGLLAALLTNQELANDLRALISNLRAHGVLFYRDSGEKIDVKPREQNPQRRQPGGR